MNDVMRTGVVYPGGEVEDLKRKKVEVEKKVEGRSRSRMI